MRALDMAGKRFGRTVAIRRGPTHKSTGRTAWLCRCDCGTEHLAVTSGLTTGDIRSCGCRGRDRSIDITGQTFGFTTALRRGPSRANSPLAAMWFCRCICGKEHLSASNSLRQGKTKSCGCQRYVRKRRDLAGQVQGRLTFKSYAHSDKFHDAFWNVTCICGTEKVVSAHSVLRGLIKSCGCLLTEYHTRLRPYEALFNEFVGSCNKRKGRRTTVPNSITYRQFLQFTKETQCHYCWDDLKWTEYGTTTNGGKYQLDRKNNAFGYSVKNCVVCCTQCNMQKSHRFTYEEWWKSTQWRRDEIGRGCF
jgi:hypothetical protein